MRFITIRKTQVLRIVIAIANNVCYNMYKPYCYAEFARFWLWRILRIITRI